MGSAATKTIDSMTEKLKLTVVGNPVEMKQSCTADTVEACRALAKEFAEALKA